MVLYTEDFKTRSFKRLLVRWSPLTPAGNLGPVGEWDERTPRAAKPQHRLYTLDVDRIIQVNGEYTNEIPGQYSEQNFSKKSK